MVATAIAIAIGIIDIIIGILLLVQAKQLMDAKKSIAVLVCAAYAGFGMAFGLVFILESCY
jgi:uncharacterized protein YjeT (DUF2065 family)